MPAKPKPHHGSEVKQKAKDLFRKWDKNKDGILSYEEIKGFLKEQFPTFSETQLQQLFCSIDRNQDGKIELDEFCNYIFDGTKRDPDISREPPQKSPTTVGVREQWKQATLDAHNERRKLHGSPQLEWSDECYLSAKKQADACQKASNMFHGHCEGPSGRHGQNAFWSSRPGSSADYATGCWYDELTDPGYDFSQPGFKSGIGHFTQVVWKSSTHVGMAVSEDGCFVIANYFPAGNMNKATSFAANVLPPEGLSRPKKSVPEDVPQKQGHKDDAGPGDKTTSCEAGEMTAELEAALEGCPFPFKDSIVAAFSNGATQVGITREATGNTTKITVLIKKKGGSSKMSGSWGGG